MTASAAEPPDAVVYSGLVPGIEPAATERWLDVAPPFARCAAGLHPWFLPDTAPDDSAELRAIARLAERGDVVAVGEVGLDHYRHPAEARTHVADWFRAQAALAHDVNKPLVVHCVRAHGDCLEVLRAIRPQAGGVVHAFSGSLEVAAEYHRLGFRVGIGPAVTRERASRVRGAAAGVPLEQLLIETDAPYMAAGDRSRDEGQAADLVEVCTTIAALRGTSVQDIADATYRNAVSLFRR